MTTIPVRAHERKAPDKPPMAFHDEIQARIDSDPKGETP